MPTAISLASASRTGVNLRYFYESKIGDLVILHNAAALYIIPRRFFTLDGRLENYSYIFVALHDVPVCYDVSSGIDQGPRPETIFGSDQHHCW
jgi:hypothetical protein